MGQAHTRAYRDIPVYFPETGIRPRLVAVADNVPERLDLARDNFGFASGTLDWRELIARDDVDVVDVTAPNALHREIVEAAAAAGKHIACEKPVGIDPEATAAIEVAARRAGVISGCGYNYRWAPLVQYTRQLIADGRLGELTHYRGRFFSMYGRDRLGLLSWRFSPGGGRLRGPERPHVTCHRHGPVHVRADRPGRGREGDLHQAAAAPDPRRRHALRPRQAR